MSATDTMQTRLAAERVRDELARQVRDPLPGKPPQSTLVLDKEPLETKDGQASSKL